MLEPWSLQQNRLFKGLAWRFLEKRNHEGATLIHATALEEARSIRAMGIQTPIVVAPNGIVMPAERMAEVSDRPTALFLSRLHPKKGLDMLLQVWAELARPDWLLRIAGSGDEAYVLHLQETAARLGLANRVEFSGPLHGAQKSAAFWSASFFVLPTFSENFGNAVAEALAHGTPVITTHGAPWSVVRDGEMGWWIPAEPGALRKALAEAMECSPVDLRSMGQRGRKHARGAYSWDVIAASFDEAIDWVRGGGVHPSHVLPRGVGVPEA